VGRRRRAVHRRRPLRADRCAPARVALTARLLVEYDGSGFAGWAAQPGLRTVQGELEDSLAQVRGEPVRLTVAGRTDAGVHARGQVASHAGTCVDARALNGLLGPDVRVLASERAAEGFDARRDARARTYRYRVLTGPVAGVFERDRALHWRFAADRDALAGCAALLLGTHDFTAFTPTRTDHVRFERIVTRAEWVEEDACVVAFWIEADAFMRHMVRTLVGTMLGVAAGRMTVERFDGLLAGCPRSEAGDTAPAHGLCLESIRY
jgi:tRNA pseudouridine38-40 synthase